MSYIRFPGINFLPILICVLWFFPITILGFFTAPLGTVIFSAAKFPLIFFCLINMLAQRNINLNTKIIFFLFFAFLSSLASQAITYSGIRYIVLALSVAFFSPLITSNYAIKLREEIWEHLGWASLLVVMLSIFFEVGSIQLPQLYFKEGNPGITTHAMLYGPISGFASLFLFSKACTKEKKRKLYIFLSIICLTAVFSSLSRIAITATILGLTTALLYTLKLEKSKFFILALVIAGISLITALSYLNQSDKYGDADSGSAFTQKGSETSSRTELWDERLREFKSNPILGIGVGVSQEILDENILLNGEFIGFVEPGSTYLVILSMTGLLGAISLSIAIGFEFLNFLNCSKYIQKYTNIEILGMGVFFIVHGVAEGWIYSPGGIICIMFWLWFGRMVDATKKILNKEWFKML